MSSPVTWKDGTRTLGSIREQLATDNKERERGQADAAAKARWILGETIRTTHPYLVRKGSQTKPETSGLRMERRS
jgi:hypothetical protein